MNEEHLRKAALRGEPSYVWRAGQERRLAMILAAAGERAHGRVLVDGCGVGMYLARLSKLAVQAVGLDIEHERTVEAHQESQQVVCGAGERLPFPDGWFDLVLSHEVLEHVQDDQAAIREIVRVLRPGGRLVLFVPNRGYPFETHGIYWRGRTALAIFRWSTTCLPAAQPPGPARARVCARRPAQFVRRPAGAPRAADRAVSALTTILSPAARQPGKLLRDTLQALERTPLKMFGLSLLWVVEKI
jgi:SAM-dependent methyltransferase